MKKKIFLLVFLIVLNCHICFSETNNSQAIKASNKIKTIHAILNYKNTLIENPNDAKAYYDLGLALVNMGEEQVALEKFSKARELFMLQGDHYLAMEVSAAMGAIPFRKGLRQMQESIENLSSMVEEMDSKIESNSRQLNLILKKQEDNKNITK